MMLFVHTKQLLRSLCEKTLSPIAPVPLTRANGCGAGITVLCLSGLCPYALNCFLASAFAFLSPVMRKCGSKAVSCTSITLAGIAPDLSFRGRGVPHFPLQPSTPPQSALHCRPLPVDLARHCCLLLGRQWSVCLPAPLLPVRARFLQQTPTCSPAPRAPPSQQFYRGAR